MIVIETERLTLKKIGFSQTGEGKVFSLSKQENIPCLNYEYFTSKKN